MNNSIALRTTIERADETGKWVEYEGRALSLAPKEYVVTDETGTFRESYQPGAFKRTIDQHPEGHHFYGTHETKGQLPAGRTFFRETESTVDVRIRLARGAVADHIESLYELGYNNVSIGGWVEKQMNLNGVRLYTEVGLDHLAFVARGALDDAQIQVVRHEVEAVNMDLLRRMEWKLRLARAG